MRKSASKRLSILTQYHSLFSLRTASIVSPHASVEVSSTIAKLDVKFVTVNPSAVPNVKINVVEPLSTGSVIPAVVIAACKPATISAAVAELSEV